jgi:hypothetical protein
VNEEKPEDEIAGSKKKNTVITTQKLISADKLTFFSVPYRRHCKAFLPRK